MSDINARDFGRLEEQVRQLHALIAQNHDDLKRIGVRIGEIDDLLQQTRGGWRALLWLTGAAAALGSAVTTVAAWWKGSLL